MPQMVYQMAHFEKFLRSYRFVAEVTLNDHVDLDSHQEKQELQQLSVSLPFIAGFQRESTQTQISVTR